MSVIGTDSRKLVWCNLNVSGRMQFWICEICPPCGIFLLIWFSEDKWACIVFLLLLLIFCPCFFYPLFFSGVWGCHQGWAFWSYSVPRLPSSIWAQPALHVDHWGCPWKHHQVSTTPSASLFPCLLVFWLHCSFPGILSVHHLSIYFQFSLAVLQWYSSLSLVAV